jgi:lytic murein transglycosylase
MERRAYRSGDADQASRDGMRRPFYRMNRADYRLGPRNKVRTAVFPWPQANAMVPAGGGKRTAMLVRLIALVMFMFIAAPAWAAQCGGDFHQFLSQMAREAEAAGVSPNVVNTAFAGLSPDASVIAFDHRQRYTFRKSFEEYARTRVTSGRIARAKSLMRRHAQLLSRIEQRFGVPAPLLMAIWTMETDNGGGDMGKLPVIRTLATLAHDCRRSELFQRELIAALKIVQRGDLPLRDLIGAYAGEIGQTQFLPSSYIKYGVDFDGNGRVDLRHSVPDVLASTANLLKQNGWHAGAPYGPGTANFEVMREWNRAEVYRRALVLMAERIGQ